MDQDQVDIKSLFSKALKKRTAEERVKNGQPIWMTSVLAIRFCVQNSKNCSEHMMKRMISWKWRQWIVK